MLYCGTLNSGTRGQGYIISPDQKSAQRKKTRVTASQSSVVRPERVGRHLADQFEL